MRGDLDDFAAADDAGYVADLVLGERLVQPVLGGGIVGSERGELVGDSDDVHQATCRRSAAARATVAVTP